MSDLPITPLQKRVLLYVVAEGPISCRGVALGLGIKDSREARRRLEALTGRGHLTQENGAPAMWSPAITMGQAEAVAVLDGSHIYGKAGRAAAGSYDAAGATVKRHKPVIAGVLAYQTAECPPHHWMIESPNGTSTVGALCRKCGLTRDYLAASPDVLGNLPMVIPASEKVSVTGGYRDTGKPSVDKHSLRKPISHMWGGSAVSVESQRRASAVLVRA